MEVWKDLCENRRHKYEISTFGRVKCDGVIKEYSLNKGYLRFIEPWKLLHRAVAETFIPNPKNKKTVNHIDGDKTNNHVSNLEWSTSSENMQHAFSTGLNNHHDKRKLTFEQAEEIRAKYIPCVYTVRQLAKEYGIAIRGTLLILHNKTYTR